MRVLSKTSLLIPSHRATLILPGNNWTGKWIGSQFREHVCFSVIKMSDECVFDTSHNPAQRFYVQLRQNKWHVQFRLAQISFWYFFSQTSLILLLWAMHNITSVIRTVIKTGQLKSYTQYFSLMFPLCGVTQKWKEMAHLYHTSCGQRDRSTAAQMSVSETWLRRHSYYVPCSSKKAFLMDKTSIVPCGCMYTPHISCSWPTRPGGPQHHNHAALCWTHLTKSEKGRD